MPTCARHVHEITEQSFDSEVLAAAVPVLVDFTAPWCPPCRALEPVLVAVAAAGAERLKVVSLDGDAYPAIGVRFGVKAFPTVIVFIGGKEVARHVGLTTKEKLLALAGA